MECIIENLWVCVLVDDKVILTVFVLMGSRGTKSTHDTNKNRGAG